MISNSSPLILFGKLNKLDLLKKVFGQIEIAKSVYEEVIEKGIAAKKIESFIIKEWVEKGFILVRELNVSEQEKSCFLRRAYPKLDAGEADTIALAMQKNERSILIDEKAARKIAELYGILPIGTLGVLLLAYQKKIVNESVLKEIIDKLILSDFRVGAEVINEFWKMLSSLKSSKK
ncbi:MAG: DUF3368 domain-containing protein [Nanoarchaeota archaeon]